MPIIACEVGSGTSMLIYLIGMSAKVVVIINLIWQSVFLVGSIESFTKLSRLGVVNTISFGYLWPSLLWGLSIMANLFYLIYLIKLKENIKQKKFLFFSFLLVIAPIAFSYLIGQYYQFKFFNVLMK